MRNSTFTEKLAIKELFEKYLHPIKNSNCFRFEKGWDDKKIAQGVSSDLTHAHARHVRLELFGRVKRLPSEKTRIPIMKERIRLLENKFEKLINMIGLNPEQQKVIMETKDDA